MVDTSKNNLFIYWSGRDYKLIKMLRGLIYHHSGSGNNYHIHFINRENVTKYCDIPRYFDNLMPAHQADWIRICVIKQYGGIWLDSDTLVMNDLSELFSHKKGFFTICTEGKLSNSVFGCKKDSELMNYWYQKASSKLKFKTNNYEFIGNSLLTTAFTNEPSLFKDYHIYFPKDGLYSVNWKNSADEFIHKEYSNWRNILINNTPLIVLTNKVYKACEDMSELDILNSCPIGHLIKLSYKKTSSF